MVEERGKKRTYFWTNEELKELTSSYLEEKDDNYELSLYVNWEPNTYTINYNANGGTNAPGNQEKQHNIQNKYSHIAIGSHKLIYIPENHNDFIFASIISKYSTPSFILLLISFISIILYYLYNI